MAQGGDYRKRLERSKQQSKSHSGFLPGAGFGLIIGLAVAAVVHLYHLYQQNLDPKPTHASELACAPQDNKEAPARGLPGTEYGFFDELPSRNSPSPAGQAAVKLYILQAGSFDSKQKASTQMEKLEGIGFRAKSRRVKMEGQDLYRVWLGPFDIQKVQKVKETLRERGVETVAKIYRETAR